jgi:hypothetical protein
MALTTDIAPGRPRFFYVVGDRKSLHMAVKDFGTITDALKELDFAFNHDGLMGTGWYRQSFTEDDMLWVLSELDKVPELITIEANLLRLYFAYRDGGSDSRRPYTLDE